MEHFLTYLQQRLQTNWNKPALTDYTGGADYTLGEVATEMARLEILMQRMGAERGDKISLCGKNCANWGVGFLSVMAAHRVAVSILPDFTPEAIESLVTHSDSKILFVSDYIWNTLSATGMPLLKAAISLDTFGLLYSADEQTKAAYDGWNEVFQKAYPDGYSLKDVDYDVDNMDELALINYTSGTTSSPKGVMLSYRSISSNVQSGYDHVRDITPDDKLVSILPMAHMFGLALEFLFETTAGLHIYFLGKTPSPSLLTKALADVKPFMIVTVPMVLEKVFRKAIFPKLKHPAVKLLWNIPVVNIPLRKKVRGAFIKAFGGNLRYIMIGGAALNQDVEKCMKQLGLPYVVGYGMTECGPLIAFEDWQRFAQGSCGKPIARMEVRIDSEDPINVAGEIQTRGENLMLGYYKNEEATKATFTKDGWLKTGDLGLFNKQGDIYIKGRSKSMILGPSGQNIYPEEIEDQLNSLPAVLESLIVEREGKLVAIIVADPVQLRKLGAHVVDGLLKGDIQHLNLHLPKYSQIQSYEMKRKEFEKTPKKSIKRFLYQ